MPATMHLTTQASKALMTVPPMLSSMSSSVDLDQTIPSPSIEAKQTSRAVMILRVVEVAATVWAVAVLSTLPASLHQPLLLRLQLRQ